MIENKAVILMEAPGFSYMHFNNKLLIKENIHVSKEIVQA